MPERESEVSRRNPVAAPPARRRPSEAATRARFAALAVRALVRAGRSAPRGGLAEQAGSAVAGRAPAISQP